MPLYEVLLDDWDEIRLSNEPLNVGELVEIENVEWFVVGVAKTPDHTIRYLCVQQDTEALRTRDATRQRAS